MAHPRGIQPLTEKEIAKGVILVIIYIRVSSKEQEQGYSIDAQLSALRDYAARHNMIVVETIIEIASARRPGRDKFDDMVVFFKREKRKTGKRCETILTEKTDRLVRNHQDKEALLDLGVTMHMVKERLVVSKHSRSDVLYMFDQHVSNASRYSRNLGEETVKGMLQKAEEGIYPSNAPFGYQNITEASGRKIIAPDPMFAPIVKEMFMAYATGRHSLQSITDMANKRMSSLGVNRRLVKSTVGDILSNTIYYGEFVWKRRLYKGIHQPIIDKELFEQAHGTVTTINAHKRQQQKHKWLFQGLLSCGHCGCAMVAELKKGKYVYYHCTGNKVKNCPNFTRYIRQERLEEQFLGAVKRLRVPEESLGKFVTIVQNAQNDDRVKLQNTTMLLSNKIETLKRRRQELLNRLLDGKIDEERYQEVETCIIQEREELEQKLETLVQRNGTFVENAEQLQRLVTIMPALYVNQSDTEKRRLLAFMFSECRWSDGQLSPSYRRPFDALVTPKAA
ncbi:MAG: hypothetical protein CXR31_00390 [Geobacter sp.]|nr:MAG: hypothetical protein CXR31_00390 [Geobacter sp.]